MQSLTDHVLASLLTHWPRISADHDELHARLQRRHRAQLQRPPRAWCIALRASDARMTAWNTILNDCHAITARRPHEVTIDAALVKRLCAPVRIEPPGEMWDEVAAKLGVHHTSLRRQMKNGFFDVRRIAHLAGRRGRPIPVLYRPGLLDPCSRTFLPPDGFWGDAWTRRGDCIAPDFVQAIHREPVIAPPPLNFRCWIWRCPGCHNRADTLYYPLRVPWVEDHLMLWKKRRQGTGASAEEDAQRREDSSLTPAPLPLSPFTPEPLQTFACGDCHRVNHISRADNNGWNEFVTTLTCGLLYGREVDRPTNWQARKTVPFKLSHPRRAIKREEVARLLTTTDLTRHQIAIQLGVKDGAIDTLTAKLYTQHGVHSREELIQKLKPLPERLKRSA